MASAAFTTVRRTTMACLAALLAAAWLSPSAMAGPGVPGPYVALGDSVAAGFGVAPGESYVDLLYDDYKASLGADQLLNRSQSGATSTDMIQGGQLDAALADIDAASDAKAVTIDIGGNDGLRGDCQDDWDDASSCPFRANLATALGELEQALGNDPGEEPLTVMAYYNPGAGTGSAGAYDAELLGANGRLGCTDSGPDVGLNDVILQEAATLGVALADPYPAFEAAGQSLMSYDGIHPNAAGHQAIAEAFGDASVPLSCDRVPNTTINSGPTGTTTKNDPSFTFSSESAATFECRLDGPGAAIGTFASCTSPKAYTDLADGGYTFQVTAIDWASNPDPTPATRSFTVDTTAPKAKITKEPESKVRTNKKKVKVKVKFTSEAGAKFKCKLDKADYKPCTSPYSVKAKSKPGKGKKHKISIKAKDGAGNVGKPATVKFRVIREG